jgi:hypothetical protein
MAAVFRPFAGMIRERAKQEAGKRSAFAGPLFLFAGGIHN